MKKATLVSIVSFLILINFSCVGQEKTEGNHSHARTCRHFEVESYYKQQLVELIIKKTETQLSEIKKDTLQELDHIYDIVQSLGFRANKDNSEITLFLDSLARNKLDRGVQAAAISALFRIGAENTESIIEYILSSNDFNFQINHLELLWMSDNEKMLNKAIEKLQIFISKNENDRISKYIKVTLIPRLDFRLGLFKEGKKNHSIEKLKLILLGKDDKFNTIHGGIPEIWALRMLVKISPESKKGEIAKYLLDIRNSYNFLPYIRGAYHYYIDLLGESQRMESLDQKKEKVAIPFAIFQSREEVLDYYRYQVKNLDGQ